MKPNAVEQKIIHIAVVEDDPLRLVGLRSILHPLSAFQVLALTVSQVAADKTVDLVLLGNYSGVKFLETMASLRSLRPDLPVIVTGVGGNDEAILRALGCGAKGYVDETAPTAQLVQAIHTVCEGLVWAPRRVLSMFIERSRELLRNACPPAGSTLTAREKQVLQMLVEGRSNKEIGAPLGIEERTVKAHIAKMMRKVGVQNRIALSVHAISQSLVTAVQ